MGGLRVLVRLTQLAASAGELRGSVSVEREGYAPTSVAVTARFELEPSDVERLRWYLEDFLEWPLDPAPVIARGVEERLAEIGTELFRAIFQSSDDARDLWAEIRAELPTTRFEVVSDVTGPAAVPWELLRDPKTDTAVALRAATFVRAHHNPAFRVRLPAASGSVLRVLVVICRPGGAGDVPFRSVATRLMNLIGHNKLDLDVLRPPTFAALTKRLRAAAASGRPYHIVHFDGHGAYLHTGDITKLGVASLHAGNEGGRPDRSPQHYGLLSSPPRPGAHGYLQFENADDPGNEQLVDGPALGKILAETGVPVLVLNACRSAHAEAPTEPVPDDQAAQDVHGRVRAYGSLAQEVVDAGVPGVVAMRYNVWVVTAAQFVAELYEALLNGAPLGEAVTLGRKNLAEQPDQAIAFDSRPLQDWMVPVAYEAAPLRLFTPPQRPISMTVTGDGPQLSLAGLPGPPDIEFVGRDDTLLELDRAFDTHRVVLLHAYAGAGKTSTAAEFARWYILTSGLTTAHPTTSRTTRGIVLFTSFERHQPLSRVLDQLGTVFQSELASVGREWLTLTDLQRRTVALELLEQIPVLWIWDNVEPVAGFPTGKPSAWTLGEQHELVQFIRDLNASPSSKAKVLLTSRRDERAWLANVPVRVLLPAMPLRERLQLAANIVAKYKPRQRFADVEDWRPLLRYSAGNPLTLTILVRQVIGAGTTSRSGIAHFIDQLKAGGTGIEDEGEGRTSSLNASLNYGLHQAFTDTDRARLAALHLFYDAIDFRSLGFMGELTDDRNNPLVPELNGLTPQYCIRLLDRAAEIGILTSEVGPYYTIHPALPWHFTNLFRQTYGTPDQIRALNVIRAYTTTMAAIGEDCWAKVEAGERDWLSKLAAEEANLLHALDLARIHEWWQLAMGLMQGLRQLYNKTGRVVEWNRLVTNLTPDFIDIKTDELLPGREVSWSVFTDYRIQLARGARDWSRADYLQRMRLDRERLEAAYALSRPPDQLNQEEAHRIRILAICLHQLAELSREQHNPSCMSDFRETADLARRISDRQLEAIAVFNLGLAYKAVPSIYDLKKVETAYSSSLELFDETDHLGRARCHGELGSVALIRYSDARANGSEPEVMFRNLDVALKHCTDALNLVPKDSFGDLAVIHTHVGTIYGELAQFDPKFADIAMGHHRQAIGFAESIGNRHQAGISRYCIAGVLFGSANRAGEALDWAAAALRDFHRVGASAQRNIDDTKALIARING